MNQNELQENTVCASENHGAHLCHLMYEGFHFKHPQDYKEMVQDAQFRCQNCGRTAKESEQLCEPIDL
ncbi:MAG: hypothetical protein ACYSOT_02215 [Planctomycetota bacterium]|jgi:hypothetical protein